MFGTRRDVQKENQMNADLRDGEERMRHAIAAADSGLAREMTPEVLRTAGGDQD